MSRIPLRIFAAVVAALLALVGGGCSDKARHERHLARALQELAAGEYDRAEIEFLNVLQLVPGDPVAVSRLAMLYFDQGRYGKAIPLLLKAREQTPEEVPVRTRLAAALLAGGKNKEARAELDYVLEREPANPEAPLLLVQLAGRNAAGLDAVRERLSALAQSAPTNASVHAALATLDLRQRRLQDADQSVARALQLDARSSAAYSALAALQFARGESALAAQSLAKASEFASDRSPRRLLYARFKIQSGDLPGTREALKAIVQKTPDFLPAGTLLAETLLAEQKNDEAAVLIQRLLARDSTNLEVLVLSGRVKIALGQLEQATAELDKARSLYPQAPQAHHQYALTLVARGRNREAAASLNQALVLDPDFADASLLLAGISLLRTDFSGAISLLAPLVQKRPDLIRAQAMLADACRAHGDLDLALRHYENLLLRAGERPEWVLSRGAVLLQQGRTDDARKAFHRALELVPDFFPAFEQLLNLELKEKQYDTVRARVRQLAADKPNHPEPLLFLARIDLAQNDAAAALSALEKALSLRPDYRPAYVLAARVYVETGDVEKALARLRQLGESNPNDIAVFMTIGALCEQRREFTAARDAYEKLLAAQPRFAPALNNLAYLYSEHLGQLDKAAELAHKARELRPTDPQFADTLGWILYRKGEYSRALPLVGESAARLTDEPEIQFHFGMTSYMLGEEEQAQAALRRALAPGSAFPGDAEARQILAFLSLATEGTKTERRSAIDQRLAAYPNDPIALLRLARTREHDGDQAGAKNAYQSVLEINPQNIAALLGLAQLLESRGDDPPRALELAKTAYKFAPDDPFAAHTLGRLVYADGDHPLALGLLQTAARKRGNDPALLFDLALAEYSTGEVDDAASAMRAALQNAGPTFERADEARLFVDLLAQAADPRPGHLAREKIDSLLGTRPDFLPALAARAALAERAGDTGTAVKTCEEILRRFPSFSPATRRLALLRAASGTNDKPTIDLLFKAREAYSGDAELARALGLALYRAGDFSRAVTFLKECAPRYAADAEVFYCLGLTQTRLKDRQPAQQSLQTALRLDPRHPLASDAQKALSQLK